MPDNSEKSVNTRPDKDRRLHARQRIHSLSYVKMGDSNGGIVLNISEGGISVQAAAMLDPSEPVTLSLEIPRVRKRVEVNGEIAWLSASKKEAGIRFVDLPESTLKQIQKWMAREASPEQFEDETDAVEEEQETPVAVAPVEAAAVATGVVEAARDEETDVRELSEENIMNADEIDRLASEPKAVRRTAVAESEEEIEEVAEVEGEAEAEAADAAEVAATFRGEHEADEDVEEEAEVEPLAAQKAKASVEIAAEKLDGEVEAQNQHETEEESESEDELIQAFGPPVVPFERRPNLPFSSMNALAGGGRSAQNLAIAPPLLHDVQKPFVESYVAPQEAAPESGWKNFTIQLQTGWFLAALVLLLALISFIAGMAVRRGALNGVMGEQQDTLIPRSSPAPGAISRVAPATTGSTGDGTNAAVTAKPLSIEIVDLANHHWVIPASTGANRASVAQPAETDGNSTAGASAIPTKANADTSQGSSASPPAASAGGGIAPANAGKSGVPLVLSLPETPISATGSVAISSQRSVPVPAHGSKAAQNGRNLQVGQLINLVEPVYPAEAVQQKIEGTVKLHAVIGTDGAIESLAQVSGPQVLVNASMSAVRNWKYSPTRMNGQAIETQEDISFVFRLPN
jgi:TonB family protein